nr:hypothetical protein Itr_chr03CG12530 [Ipomoea trifida]
MKLSVDFWSWGQNNITRQNSSHRRISAAGRHHRAPTEVALYHQVAATGGGMRPSVAAVYCRRTNLPLSARKPRSLERVRRPHTSPSAAASPEWPLSCATLCGSTWTIYFCEIFKLGIRVDGL